MDLFRLRWSNVIPTQNCQHVSPRRRRASCMSFTFNVTRPACRHARSESSNKFTRYASLASCNARSAVLWMRKSGLRRWNTSRTSLWKGNFWIRSSVDFWYLRICRSATVPGRYLVGFFTPPHEYWCRACFVASCLRGHLPPLLFRAVCFVRAIFIFLVFGVEVLRKLKSDCEHIKQVKITVCTPGV